MYKLTYFTSQINIYLHKIECNQQKKNKNRQFFIKKCFK